MINDATREQTIPSSSSFPLECFPIFIDVFDCLTSVSHFSFLVLPCVHSGARLPGRRCTHCCAYASSHLCVAYSQLHRPQHQECAGSGTR